MGVRSNSEWSNVELPAECCGRCRCWMQGANLAGTCRATSPSMGEGGWATWPKTEHLDWCMTFQSDGSVTNPYPYTTHHAGSVET